MVTIFIASDISIHAPTRGATFQKVIGMDTLSNFNPRSHERSDVFPLGSAFQGLYFNPRSHERSDNQEAERRAREAISIHAPTRGATSFTKCSTPL